jgi:hypothetical protein
MTQYSILTRQKFIGKALKMLIFWLYSRGGSVGGCDGGGGGGGGGSGGGGGGGDGGGGKNVIML